jgi:hypothetical protein
MHLLRIARRAVEELAQVTGLKPGSVTGLSALEGGFSLEVEMVEKESIPRSMDILALYRVRLDPEGHLLGFERLGLRRRGETTLGETALEA